MSGKLSWWKKILAGFLRTFFKLLYHEMAWAYDAVAWIVSLGRWKRWVLTARQFVPPGLILELGPGPGHLLSSLAASDQTLIALEESRHMLRIASKRVNFVRNEKAEATKPLLILGKVEGLPFDTARFDCVISTFPAAYITYPDSLKQINRVLKPGGKFVVLLSVWPAGNRLADRFIRKLFRITGETVPPGINLQPVQDLLSNNGLNGEVKWIPEGTDQLLYILTHKPGDGSAEIL